MQSDVIIFTKNEDKVQINNDNEDNMQIIKDKKLPLNDNSNPSMDKPITEEPTSFTVSFDESQNTVGALSTSTGFVALKRSKLSTAQHQKSQPVITTTAQRVPAKPTRAQTINTTSSINRDVGTGTGECDSKPSQQ